MFDLLYLVFPYAVSPTPFKLWGMPATTMIPFFMSISNNGIVSTIEDDQETLWGPNCWKFFYIRDLNIPFFFQAIHVIIRKRFGLQHLYVQLLLKIPKIKLAGKIYRRGD